MYTAYGIVTVCEWSWWSCSTLVERELYAVYVQFDIMRMSIILLESTCIISPFSGKKCWGRMENV
jgi:hypothetical protein